MRRRCACAPWRIAAPSAHSGAEATRRVVSGRRCQLMPSFQEVESIRRAALMDCEMEAALWAAEAERALDAVAVAG
eukprot:730675-Prymnesium_polylepis.1